MKFFGLINQEQVWGKKAIISQKSLRSNIISLWIKNSLNTDAKRKLRYFKTSYTYNNQDYGSVMFFVVVKMVRPDTHAVCSDIKTNLESIRMSHFKHDIPKTNLHI